MYEVFICMGQNHIQDSPYVCNTEKATFEDGFYPIHFQKFVTKLKVFSFCKTFCKGTKLKRLYLEQLYSILVYFKFTNT